MTENKAITFDYFKLQVRLPLMSQDVRFQQVPVGAVHIYAAVVVAFLLPYLLMKCWGIF